MKYILPLLALLLLFQNIYSIDDIDTDYEKEEIDLKEELIFLRQNHERITNDTRWFMVISTITFGFLAWDSFSQVRDIDKTIREVGETEELRSLRERKILIGAVCTTAAVIGLAATYRINSHLKLRAETKKVELSYSFN